MGSSSTRGGIASPPSRGIPNCLSIPTALWMLWLLPYRLLNRWPLTRGVAQRLPFTLYAKRGYPFRIVHTDWFDGLSVPLVRYYRREEIQEWFCQAGLHGVVVEPQWEGRALGFAPPSLEPAGVA